MKGRADAALADLDLGHAVLGLALVPNYNGTGNVTCPGVQTLAMALVYDEPARASTGTRWSPPAAI